MESNVKHIISILFLASLLVLNIACDKQGAEENLADMITEY